MHDGQLIDDVPMVLHFLYLFLDEVVDLVAQVIISLIRQLFPVNRVTVVLGISFALKVVFVHTSHIGWAQEALAID
jgi:hypothetical protein